MLLYIGEMMEAGYLQQLSDQLQQVICLVTAPEDPLELVAMAQPQYSHYMISIKPYELMSKELVQGLKKFIESAEGKLMLLAVGMTTSSAVIRELMYAGFTNIYFLDAEVYTEAESVPMDKVTDKLQVTQDMPDNQFPTVPMYAELISTEPMCTVPMAVSQGLTEPMTAEKKNMLCLPQEERNSEGKQKPLFLLCSCLIIFFLIAINIGVAIYLLAEDATFNNSREQYVRSEVSYKTPEPAEILQTKNELCTITPSVSEAPDTRPQVNPSTPPLTVVDGSATVLPIEEPVSHIPEQEKPDDNEESTSDAAPQEQIVKPPSIPIRVLSLPESVRMVNGGSIVLEPEYKPKEATQTSFSWKSSNPDIATVKNGRVTARKAGVVTITVTTSKGKKAKCKIIIGDE